MLDGSRAALLKEYCYTKTIKQMLLVPSFIDKAEACPRLKCMFELF